MQRQSMRLKRSRRTMSLGLREFGVEVATVNPGPFLTGFNDRGFETWKSWEDDASERLFDYTKLALPRAQFDPEPVYATMTAVAAGEIETFRNLEPKSMLEETKGNIENVWTKKIRDGLGARPPGLQKSFEMEPETPVSRRWRERGWQLWVQHNKLVARRRIRLPPQPRHGGEPPDNIPAAPQRRAPTRS
jgi:hypothetical protein